MYIDAFTFCLQKNKGLICCLLQELQELKHEKQQLQERCEQQEQALQEMGLHLSQSVSAAFTFRIKYFLFISTNLLLFYLF